MTYWDNYYEGRTAPVLPSQFGVFVLGEIQPATVLDIGCGSGRDTVWFAQQGIPTIGVDSSHAAIDFCRSRSESIPHLQFMRADVSNPALPDALAGLCGGPTLVYARFFLHAISDDEQSHFLALAANVLRRQGGMLAVEFRTTRDATLAKETATHFRRFVEPADLIVEAKRHGLLCKYAVEGLGFAKYKHDDAYVSRLIFAVDLDG